MKAYKILLPRRNYRIIAPVNKRMLAFLIDLLIFFFFITTPFLSIYYTFAGLPLDTVSVDELFDNIVLFRIAMIGDFVTYIIFFFYLVASEVLFNATIGKRILHLSVISKKGKELTLLQLMLRSITKSIAITFLLFDSILMFFDPEHRRISDFVANTLVVEDRKRIKTFPVVNEV